MKSKRNFYLNLFLMVCLIIGSNSTFCHGQTGFEFNPVINNLSLGSFSSFQTAGFPLNSLTANLGYGFPLASSGFLTNPSLFNNGVPDSGFGLKSPISVFSPSIAGLNSKNNLFGSPISLYGIGQYNLAGGFAAPINNLSGIGVRTPSMNIGTSQFNQAFSFTSPGLSLYSPGFSSPGGLFNLNFNTNLMGGYLFFGSNYMSPNTVGHVIDKESFLTEEDFEHCIDFEDQSEDTVLYNQYGSLGVIFPYSPRIVSPAVATVSGVNALSTKDFGEEMDPTPLTIRFTAPQSRVGAYVGIDEDTSGAKVYATISAYDENHDLVNEYGPVSLTTGPRPINRLMYVTSDTADIWLVEIQFDNARPEFIDNLLFSAVGPAPPQDTQPPYIHILSPQNHGVYDSFEGENCFTLDGIIEENDKLKEVRMTVFWQDQSVVHNVSFSGSAPLFYFGHNTLKCLLNEGDNYIYIQAVDYGGLTDSETVQVTYVPLKQESELLLVTPWELRPALLSLANHKNNTGIPTSIISLEAIADDPRFFFADDLPEMIKLAISYAYKNYNCRYVMLVGDSDKFPVRYCRLPDPNSNGSFTPSDLYYADLYKGDGSFDNWDSNGNGYYGEINMIWGSSSTYSSIFIDKVHMRPDIAVGRLPASSYSEVVTYCDKVIAYESENYRPWFDEILLLTGDPGYNSDEATNNWIADNCLTGFTKTKYYFSQNTGTWYERAAEINNYLNQGVGFVCFVGHGSLGGYSGIYDCLFHMFGLDNADRLPIFFSAACDTARFHTLHGEYQDIHGNDPPDPPGYWEGNVPEPAAIQPSNRDFDSCAEWLLVKDPNGAIGYIGCYTGSQAGGLIFAKYFFESYDHLKPTGDIAGDPVTLGRMWNWALNKYFDNQCHYTIDLISTWYAPTMVHHAQKYLLFGDPSLRLAE